MKTRFVGAERRAGAAAGADAVDPQGRHLLPREGLRAVSFLRARNSPTTLEST